MESLIKKIIKEIIKESINYDPSSNEVYFGNKKSSDDALVDNTSGGLRIKRIDTYSNLTLNDIKTNVRKSIEDLNTPDQHGFTMSRKILIGSDTNTASGRVYINTYNLYNKTDLNSENIKKHSNLPTSVLYYAKLAKNQYQTPGNHPNWQFNYNSNTIAKDAANDFLNDTKVSRLINDFSPEIIICPDSSSSLNQEMLNKLRQSFPNAEVFSTTKISTATFFDEAGTATDLKVRRAAQHATPLISDESKTVADSIDAGSVKRAARTQQEIAQLNKSGVMDPTSIQRVNTEILSKAFFTMFHEIDQNSPANPRTLKVKIHEVGSLSAMQAWRNYLSGLHRVTYSSKMGNSTVQTDNGGIIDIRDLMFNSAIMYSSMMYLYLTQDLVKKYGRVANRNWLIGNKIDENKKRLKESYSLNKANEVQKYIGDLLIAINTLSQISDNAETEEQKQAIDEQIAVLENLLNLMNQAADTANYTQLNDIKRKIDAIQQPDPNNVTDYNAIAELISLIVLESYEGLLTKAYDFIKNKETIKIKELELVSAKWFSQAFKRILNASEIMADDEHDDYEKVLLTFNKSIVKAGKLLIQQAQDSARQESTALQIISRNPEVLYVVMEKIVENIQKQGGSIISRKIAEELEAGNNEIDINSLALKIAENIYHLVPEKADGYTNYEDIEFKKSEEPGKIDITITPDEDEDSKYTGVTKVTISLSTLFDLDIIDINNDSLARELSRGIGGLDFRNYLEKIKGGRLKRIAIIDDNIATGATFAGIVKDILDKIEKYQKEYDIIIDINFELEKTKSVRSDKFPEIMASQDVSSFKGKGSEIMTKDILLKDIICITPMIV